MIPVKKPWTNIVMGEGQDHVLPCPAYYDKANGEVTIAFELTKEEAEAVQDHKTILFKVFTYGRPIQPILPWVEDKNGNNITDPRIPK